MKNLLHIFRVAGNLTPRQTRRQLADAEQRLENLERKFQILNKHGGNGIMVLTPDGVPKFVAPCVGTILGINSQELLRMSFTDILDDTTSHHFKAAISAALAAPGTPIQCDPLLVKHGNGSMHNFEIVLTNMSHDDAIDGIIMNFRDVTMHQQTSEKLEYANRLYSFISHINQAIVHARDETELYSSACRIAVEQGAFRFAWIGLVNPSIRSIELVASAGATQKDYDYFTDYTYDVSGPIDNVINNEPYSVHSDLDTKSNSKFIVYAKKRGFKSAICLPLKKSGRIIATFNLYSSDKHFFNPQEIALLTEATNDLSFALDYLEIDKQRTLVEQRLKNSEFRLKLAQEIAHLGSWELDLETGIALWSEEALRIYGLPLDQREQSYQSWVDRIHPNDVAHVVAGIGPEGTQNEYSAMFHRVIRPDGTVRYVYCQSQFVKDSTGKNIGMHGIIHDVTVAKVAETALMESQDNLRQIVDTIPQMICAKDDDGKIVFANNSFASVFGLQRKEITNKRFDVLPNGRQLESFLNDDLNQNPEFRINDFDGLERIFHVSKVSYTIPGKSMNAVLAIATDITMDKLAEDERTKLLADLVQRNNDLEQFSFIVSHNLRAPLANIIGLTTELADEGHNIEIRTELHSHLSNSVRRLDNVITDLNRIVQIKTDINEVREEVNLEELINDIKSSLANLITEEQVQFKIDLGVTKITTLKSYQHSIFYNLISNSIKYRRPGVAPVIHIQSKGTLNGVRLVFKDNGMGIDLDKRKDKLFDLYSRFHHHVEGKGIGLFMVKTQVETLGGKIFVNSNINSGTEFTIEYKA